MRIIAGMGTDSPFRQDVRVRVLIFISVKTNLTIHDMILKLLYQSKLKTYLELKDVIF